MVRAVSDVVKEVPGGPDAESGMPSDVEDDALFAEVIELSQWCHRLPDVDISRSEELANRLSVLHQALIDRFEDPQHLGAGAPGTTSRETAERVGDQAQQLLTTCARFVGQLRNGPSSFGNWIEVCDQLDELVAQFRIFVRAENEFTRVSSDKARESRGGPVGNGHN